MSLAHVTIGLVFMFSPLRNLAKRWAAMLHTLLAADNVTLVCALALLASTPCGIHQQLGCWPLCSLPVAVQQRSWRSCLLVCNTRGCCVFLDGSRLSPATLTSRDAT